MNKLLNRNEKNPLAPLCLSPDDLFLSRPAGNAITK
jgi:hypothetical protein